MDRYEICTQVWCGVKTKSLFSKISLPTPTKFGWEKSKNFTHCHQSDARNFKTAQHIDKQITDVSWTITAVKR